MAPFAKREQKDVGISTQVFVFPSIEEPTLKEVHIRKNPAPKEGG